GLTASSTSCAISHSAGSLARSSKRSCDWRSETMLRARSRRTSASTSLVNSDCMMKALVAPGAVEVTAHHEQTCEAPFPYDFHRREVVEGFVAGGHPPVGQLAVLGKEQAQILVDAQQMADAFVLVAAGADGFTLAVASERGAVARGDAQQRGLIFGVELPVIEERHDHAGEYTAVFGRVGLAFDSGDHERLLSCFISQPYCTLPFR